MGQTLTEKIVQRYAIGLDDGHIVRSGDTLWLQPAHVLTHDNTAAVIPKFAEFGMDEVYGKNQPVIALDHNVQDRSEQNKRKYDNIEHFASDQGLSFFPAGRGIGHQVMIEEGFAFPGSFCVASDSHSNMYGGIGCLGTPIVRSDAAGIWATGKMWWTVPPVVKVILENQIQPDVSGKDVILTLISEVGREAILNRALEFSGEGVSSLSIDDRLTIANMTTEWSALTGLFPFDQQVLDWLFKQQERHPHNPRFSTYRIQDLDLDNLVPDRDAVYEKTITVDLASISPTVTGANDLSTILTGAENTREKIKIDKAYLVSCVNSRTSDLMRAVEILADKTVHPDVDLYVSPASAQVQEDLKESGSWQTLINAGAKILPSGCGPCIGLGAGLLEAGEVGISSTNRNFPGRMGHRDSQVYLSSPEVVAASAVNGFITGGDRFNGTVKIHTQNHMVDSGLNMKENTSDQNVILGALLFCPADNITTDGIFPSRFTYDESLTESDMADLAMVNYDQNFGNLAQTGDILVAGYNFGAGSSREQAVTALKAKGIQLVIAASFSATFKRNALNNGYGLVVSPELYDSFKSSAKIDMPTVRPGVDLTVDFKSSSIQVSGLKSSFQFEGWSRLEQDLINSAGLNNYIENH